MKQINKLLIVFGISFALYSCQSTSNVTGTYLMQNNPHKFIFNADSTFEYSYIIAGFEDKHSSGKWSQIGKNMIVLNSNVKSNVLSLDVNIIPTKNKRNNVRIDIAANVNNAKEYRAVPFVNEILSPTLNPDRGSYDFDLYTPINKIYFKVSKEPMLIERLGPYKEYNVLKTESKTLNLNEGDSVCIVVNTVDSLFSYRVFNNTEIKFSENKLIFKDSEDKNKISKLYLKK